MKIQSVSIKNYHLSKKNNIINKSKSTVSFKGMPATPHEILETRMYARDVFESAQKSYNEGSKLISKAYDKLNNAKSLYLEALEYSNIFKKGFKGKDIQLPDGKTLEVTSSYNQKKGLEPTFIKVFDKDKNKIRDIYFYNGYINKIVENIAPNQIRITTFDGFNVDILDELDTKTRDIGTKYSFYRGKIKDIKTNITTVPFASYSENFYAYKNDSLFVHEQGTKILFDGGYSVKQRFSFIDGYLANYYKNFSIDSKKTYKWDESCHFSQNTILGKTQKATQKARQVPIVAESAIYLSGRTLVCAKNVICKIADNKFANFIEQN